MPQGFQNRHSSRIARRPARAAITVVLLVVAIGAGALGGYWLPKRLTDAETSGPVNAADGSTNADEQWYTCGMHPNVLQKGPGNCPICQMKLTPRKKEADTDGAADAGPTERKVLYWRAPMNPGFISDKPGKSPMGMDLVPVYADKAASASAHMIRIDPVTIQNMGIRTTVVERGPLAKTIRTVGRIDYDEQLVHFVDTKFDGWIEQLYVDETGQPVEKGQPLFGIFSRELYSAQSEYLFALRNLPKLEQSTFAPAREEAAKTVEAAVTKLRYFDLSDDQIDKIRETGEVFKTLTIESPASGIVTEKMALQGMYTNPGMRLYTIADLSRVWVYVDVYEYQLPWVRVAQPASMTLPYIPGESFEGKVVYIYPYLDERTRVIKVRLEFENHGMELKPGMYANVRLESKLKRDALMIPREAYIDSGTRKLTFVDRGEGKFTPRDIVVGVEAEDGMVEVLHGLDEGEVVVTSGQFLLDAESKLKEAVAKMMEIERAKTTKRVPDGAAHDRAAEEAAKPTDAIPADAVYACPMDEHPDQSDPANQGPYFSPEPGTCPRCGMKLKPLDELDWVEVRRAAHGAEVAYACPDHDNVVSDKPGECPRCGKSLSAFRVMYTCPDPAHADVIRTSAGNCPRCGRGLATFRGVWLDEQMAAANVPPVPQLAENAPYRCPTHPLVHSDRPGRCTICGRPLESTTTEASAGEKAIPPGATGDYVCPMHPNQVQTDEPGTCSICGMQLVPRSTFQHPHDAPARVAAQINYLTEHYLELQRLLAADKSTGVARQALAIASASEELLKHLDDPDASIPVAARKLHEAALKTAGTSLEEDRVAFVALSAAMRTLIEQARPDRSRWPKLYIYHCPMSKGDWIQPGAEKRNPYYGFKMLKCGELKEVE